MDDPVFAPDSGRYLSKELSRLEGIAELGAEDAGERFDGQQKVFACGAPASRQRSSRRR